MKTARSPAWATAFFAPDFLTPEAIAETVKVLRRFHRAVQQEGADSVRVVATSALRDARNSRAFLEWVRSTTGWKVEIISGLEEARLIHLGLVSTLRVTAAPVLMVDLGGGSCELTISSQGHIRETVSLPLGAVRLTNEFLQHDPPRKAELRRLRGFVEREIGRIADRIVRSRPKAVIATSGTAASLAAVCHGLYKTKGPRATAVSRAQMRRIAKMLSRQPLEQRDQTAWGRAAAGRNCDRGRRSLCRTSGTLPTGWIPLFPVWDCATACWPKWRRNTTAARGRESTSNRSGGTRSGPP